MPIGQIKAFSWLLAATLTVGLSYYVFTFITELKAREAGGLVDQAEIKTALEDVPAITEQKDDVIDYQRVRTLFHEGQLNWTGYEAPPVVQVAAPTAEQLKPKYTPVDEILKVLMIQYDPIEESRSVAWVNYTANSGVAASIVRGYSLSVGDPLESPHDRIKVKAIGQNAETGRLEVTFEFSEEGRDPETLGTETFDTENLIVYVDDETGLKTATRKPFPVGVRGTATPRGPTNTRRMAKNEYKLGSADLQDIEQNYPELINQLRPRRHRDPRTGRFDGIEIGQVPSGSLAARHGAETGDVIKSINGNAVSSPAEAIAFAKNNADKYDKWEIVVERRGKEETITYTPPD